MMVACHSATLTPSRTYCISRAAWYSALKSAPVSIVGSICRKAVYMIASRCRPENLPGNALSVYLSSGSLMSRRSEERRGGKECA